MCMCTCHVTYVGLHVVIVHVSVHSLFPLPEIIRMCILNCMLPYLAYWVAYHTSYRRQCSILLWRIPVVGIFHTLVTCLEIPLL